MDLTDKLLVLAAPLARSQKLGHVRNVHGYAKWYAESPRRGLFEMTQDAGRSTQDAGRRSLGAFSFVASTLVLSCSNAPDEPNGRSTNSVVRPTQAESAQVATAPPEPPSEPALVAELRQTAAVVEGTVTDVNETFDEWFGPRTVVTLGAVEAHVGKWSGGDVTLSLLGGPLPGGRRLSVSHQAKLALGGRYLVWLRSGAWRYHPTVRCLGVAKAGTEDVVTSDMGYAIHSVSDRDGLRVSPLRLLDVDRSSPLVAPRATAELAAQGASLIDARQVLTKDLLVRALQDLAALHEVGAGEFDPVPDLATPWNEIPTAQEG